MLELETRRIEPHVPLVKEPKRPERRCQHLRGGPGWRPGTG